MRREAIAFLRGAHTESGGALATALADAVLGAGAEVPSAWMRLALDIRDADSTWAAKAVFLASFVLDDVAREDSPGDAGGGQP